MSDYPGFSVIKSSLSQRQETRPPARLDSADSPYHRGLTQSALLVPFHLLSIIAGCLAENQQKHNYSGNR